MFNKLAGIVGAAALAASASVHAQAEIEKDRWTFSITPYLWLPNVNGTLRYSAPPGFSAPDVEINPSTILGDLKAAALIAGEARRDRFSVFTDFMYMRFGSEASKVKSVDIIQVGRNPVSSSLDAGTNSTLKGTVWTLAGSYSLLESHPGALELLGGFRYLGVDASTNWNLTATISGPNNSVAFPRSGSVSNSVNIWDALLGLRGMYRFGESGWVLTYYGDLGFYGTNSTNSYQWLLGINYYWHWGGVNLAYRQLYYDQPSDKLLQNVRFSGPALGVTFRF